LLIVASVLQLDIPSSDFAGVALTIRARTAAANDDCATLAKIDAEV
jgi:hypothetical protein